MGVNQWRQCPVSIAFIRDSYTGSCWVSSVLSRPGKSATNAEPGQKNPFFPDDLSPLPRPYHKKWPVKGIQYRMVAAVKDFSKHTAIVVAVGMLAELVAKGHLCPLKEASEKGIIA